MAKVFEFRPHTKSLSDKISGVIPVNTSVIFRRLEKGHTAYFSSTADLDGFGVIAGVKTIVMVIKPTADTKLLQDNGADKLEITGGDISGTGLTEGTVNTVNTDAVVNNTWSLVIAEFSGGIDFSTDLEIDVTANIDIMNVICYDEILSALQKSKLWDEFNHLNSISTPTIIRPHISVDPTDCVFCHDYQLGHANDLSGNGLDGYIVGGGIDFGSEGAVFSGGVNTNYIKVDDNALLDIPNNLTLEVMVLQRSTSSYQGTSSRAWGSPAAYSIALNTTRVFLNSPDGWWNSNYVINADKQWHYIILTFDASNNMILYVNGVNRNSMVTTLGSYAASTRYIKIGAHSTAFDGIIKFVRLLPVALTEPQIQASWNKIARQAVFNESMFNQLPDQRSYTAGMWAGNWQVSSGTFTVTEDSTGTYIECSANGVIQYTGVDLSVYHENGFIKRIVGDISGDQGDTVDNATNIAWVNNSLSVTLTTGQKLYDLVITKGEEV